MSKPTFARKKPVVVEYVLWHGSEKSLSAVAKLFDTRVSVRAGGAILINTLEGVMTAWPGDYIVKGVEGECYPVKASIFAKTFTKLPGRARRSSR